MYASHNPIIPTITHVTTIIYPSSLLLAVRDLEGGGVGYGFCNVG